jgi:hypothetical protein
MRPDRALFYLCGALWIVNGLLWQTLDGHTGLAITSMVIAIGCAVALRITRDQ